MSTEGDPPGGPPQDPTPPTADESAAETLAPVIASTSDAPAHDTPSKPAAPASEPPPVASKPARPATEPATSTVFLEAATDDSILPTTFVEGSLEDAVGVRRSKKPKRNDDDDLDDDGLPDETKWSRKTIAVIALAIIVGLGVTALVLLGRVNSQRYVLACTTSQAIAEQGRAFPPWGSSPLVGAEWKPIALPANAHCKRQELETRSQLEAVFLDVLLERSSATLTLRNFLDTPAAVVTGKAAESPLDLASNQLEQALLLSRSPERGDQRKQVERLQGDVQYWRASLRLRDATAAMTEASRQFDQAALARPMHVSDAGAWAEFLRRLNDELKAGPNGVPAGFPPAPTSERPGAPTGTALPVEPPPATGSGEAPAATPDAGVPSGGVLL